MYALGRSIFLNKEIGYKLYIQEDLVDKVFFVALHQMCTLTGTCFGRMPLRAQDSIQPRHSVMIHWNGT